MQPDRLGPKFPAQPNSVSGRCCEVTFLTSCHLTCDALNDSLCYVAQQKPARQWRTMNPNPKPCMMCSSPNASDFGLPKRAASHPSREVGSLGVNGLYGSIWGFHRVQGFQVCRNGGECKIKPTTTWKLKVYTRILGMVQHSPSNMSMREGRECSTSPRKIAWGGPPQDYLTLTASVFGAFHQKSSLYSVDMGFRAIGSGVWSISYNKSHILGVYVWPQGPS